MTTTIRVSSSQDLTTICKLIKESFKDDKHSDHQEQFLVQRLLQSPEFIPQLSLVYTIDNHILGYILFSKIIVGTEKALVLAPLVVDPKHQDQGIGSQLIKAGHKITLAMGFSQIVVFDYPNFYSRFGYKIKKGSTNSLDLPEKYILFSNLNKTDYHIIFPEEFSQ